MGQIGMYDVSNKYLKGTQRRRQSLQETQPSVKLICVTDLLFIHDIPDRRESKGRHISNRCLIANDFSQWVL